ARAQPGRPESGTRSHRLTSPAEVSESVGSLRHVRTGRRASRCVALIGTVAYHISLGRPLPDASCPGDSMIPRTLFDEEHDMFRDAARKFIATEITPFHHDWEREGVVPRELWRKAGDAGLLCPNVP